MWRWRTAMTTSRRTERGRAPGGGAEHFPAGSWHSSHGLSGAYGGGGTHGAVADAPGTMGVAGVSSIEAMMAVGARSQRAAGQQQRRAVHAGGMNGGADDGNGANRNANEFTVDMERILSGADQRTTGMIRNIPNKVRADAFVTPRFFCCAATVLRTVRNGRCR